MLGCYPTLSDCSREGGIAVEFTDFLYMVAANVVSRFIYDWLKDFFKTDNENGNKDDN